MSFKISKDMIKWCNGLLWLAVRKENLFNLVCSMYWYSSCMKFSFLQIKDDFAQYSMNHFCIPKHYEDDLETIMIPRGLVLDR